MTPMYQLGPTPAIAPSWIVSSIMHTIQIARSPRSLKTETKGSRVRSQQPLEPTMPKQYTKVLAAVKLMHNPRGTNPR